jgi:aldehyde:ferredoxin oxidoreductase
MGNGYWQQILRIDLTNRRAETQPIEERDLRHFIGGAGLGGEILRREVGPRQDPYGQENRLIFATGPFQGPPVPGGAKFSVVGISPVTHTFGDTAAGASWGPALKDAGYDVLLVEGKADQPVYLSIVDDVVEIRDAADLYGLDTFETVDAVHEATGDKKLSVAAIGPAGERRVAIGCIAFDKHSFAGRCGMGAVMGAKNLKAIAVRGTRQVPVHAPGRVKDLARELPRWSRRTSSASTARPVCANRLRPWATCRSDIGMATCGRKEPPSSVEKATPKRFGRNRFHASTAP